MRFHVRITVRPFSVITGFYNSKSQLGEELSASWGTIPEEGRDPGARAVGVLITGLAKLPGKREMRTSTSVRTVGGAGG